MSTVARMLPRGIPDRVLRQVEDIIPEPRLEWLSSFGR